MMACGLIAEVCMVTDMVSSFWTHLCFHIAWSGFSWDTLLSRMSSFVSSRCRLGPWAWRARVHCWRCLDEFYELVRRTAATWRSKKPVSMATMFVAFPSICTCWHSIFTTDWYCYNSHRLFSFLPTLTPLWLISLTLITHHYHTCSTMTHISRAYDSSLPHLLHCDSSTPIVLLLYIQLDTYL